jgi:hypothetical protein
VLWLVRAMEKNLCRLKTPFFGGKLGSFPRRFWVTMQSLSTQYPVPPRR